MMFSFGIKIALLLLLIGGITALVGDYIGRSIGRRRLTIFHLRPRHTAFAVTAITGALIALITLTVILAISEDARTAFFGLQELKNNLNEKSQNLEASRKGNMLFKVDEVLLTSVIKAGPEKNKLEAGIKQILSVADAYVRRFGIKTQEHLILISPEEFDRVVSVLKQRRGENIATLVVNRNTLFGEPVPVRINLSENKIIYRAGEEISSTIIAASTSIPEIEQEIKKLLMLTNQTARKSGLLSGAGGGVGSVPYSDIFELTKEIKSYGKRVRLATLARNNIYAIGPLEIEFKVYYQ